MALKVSALFIVTRKMKLTHWLEPGDALAAPLTSIKKKFTLSPWSEVTLFRGSASYNNINEKNGIIKILFPFLIANTVKRLQLHLLLFKFYLNKLTINKIV